MRLQWDRRAFLSALSAMAASFAGGKDLQAAPVPSAGREQGSGYYGWPGANSNEKVAVTGFGSTGDVYAELGIVPLMNGSGTLTVIGGSLIPPEVEAVMRMASEHFVVIDDLERAVGQQIAQLLKLPNGYTGLITAGAAAALLVGYAAILTGDNKQWIRQIPDLTGMPKSEVIIQKSHRYAFDHQIRQTGVKLIEVETHDDLLEAINPRTAAMHFTNLCNPQGQIKVDEWVKIAHAHNLPAYNDAAADTPPISRLWEYVNMGYDLVTFSGGKDIRGPQCAGLLLGRQDLISAALMNMSPQEDTIGRPCKVGKEEIVGMLKALELFVASDQDALLKQYYAMLGTVSDAVTKVPGVTTSYQFDPNQIDNHTVSMTISWDTNTVKLTEKEVRQQLTATRPISIRMGDPVGNDANRDKGAVSNPSIATIGVSAWQLKPGEERVIARRLAEILHGGVAS
ncbi:MAG TPA: aminotransferase class V-fold PLP-dependent enzyme [Candidatus Aquilonibacter sp.]|nr:aminotransferase class V-fold PLP-dependent enzyme [Candidatus Aquilonibacter sp.]